jgi:hypothetical protein
MPFDEDVLWILLAFAGAYTVGEVFVAGYGFLVEWWGGRGEEEEEEEEVGNIKEVVW